MLSRVPLCHKEETLKAETVVFIAVSLVPISVHGP